MRARRYELYNTALRHPSYVGRCISMAAKTNRSRTGHELNISSLRARQDLTLLLSSMGARHLRQEMVSESHCGAWPTAAAPRPTSSMCRGMKTIVCCARGDECLHTLLVICVQAEKDVLSWRTITAGQEWNVGSVLIISRLMQGSVTYWLESGREDTTALVIWKAIVVQCLSCTFCTRNCFASIKPTYLYSRELLPSFSKYSIVRGIQSSIIVVTT